MKYILYKDGCGFAVYDPNDGSVKHTQQYAAATEAELSDWSDVLGFDFGDYHQILCASDASVEYIEIGKRWRKDSSIEEWFPFSAQKLKLLEAEVGNAAARENAKRGGWPKGKLRKVLIELDAFEAKSKLANLVVGPRKPKRATRRHNRKS
jgi:hypothetical protein